MFLVPCSLVDTGSILRGADIPGGQARGMPGVYLTAKLSVHANAPAGY
jgi:hypothetical protein